VVEGETPAEWDVAGYSRGSLVFILNILMRTSLTAMDTGVSGILVCITSVRSRAPCVTCRVFIRRQQQDERERGGVRGGGDYLSFDQAWHTLLSENYAQSVFCLF